MNAFAKLGKLPKGFLFAVTLLSIPLMGIADWLSGPEMALSIFYLIPVSLAAWFVGRWAGIFLAAASGVTWLVAELECKVTYSQAWIPYWNALVRAGILVFSATLMAEVARRKRATQVLLKEKNAALQAEIAERLEAERQLKALNETLEQRVMERSAAAQKRSQELARSEAALRTQTEILRSILNSMGDGVIVADARGNILLCNPEAERLLQTSLEGGTFDNCLQQHETYLPDMLSVYPSHEHPLERAVRGEPVHGAEMFLRHPNAQEGIWLRITGRPLTDAQDAVQGGVIVFSDITSRKLLEKQIAQISEREQRRIGQDLHDGLCQQLVSASLTCAVLHEQLAEKNLPEVAPVKEITGMLNDCITQARNLARGFYPVRLEIDGLASALEELAQKVESLTDVTCQFTCDAPVIIHDRVAGVNLYRIAQEAVNNAIKHSRALHITIDLDVVEEEVTLTVTDDGIGFPPMLRKNGGMGLHIMSYRARMIGASFDVRRGVGGGTTVSCFFRNVDHGIYVRTLSRETA